MPRAPDLIEHWDQLWEDRPQGPLWKHRAAAELVEEGPVLDVACGSGNTMQLLAERGIPVLGCDVSPVALGAVRAKELPVVRCDLEAPLPFRDGAFRVVTLVNVLEHFFEPERLLGEASRVAEEIVVVVPNFNSVTARWQMLRGRVPENNTRRKRHVVWFNYRVLRQVSAAAGLQVRAERFQGYLSGSAVLSHAGRLLARARPPLFSLGLAVRLTRA